MGSAQGNLSLLDPWAKPSLGALGQTQGLELTPDTRGCIPQGCAAARASAGSPASPGTLSAARILNAVEG